MNKLRHLVGVGLLFLAACAAPVKRAPTPEPAPSPVPTLEKTNGNLKLDSDGTLVVQYKTIRIVVDPAPSTTQDFSQVDYVLLTDAAPRLISARKDIKVMAPPAAVAALQRQGLAQVKGVSSGQRLYLKKDEAFLFAGPVSSGQGDKMKNGYLLEFDNGRNIFVSGRMGSADPLREFVFSLRDDGKEVHAAVLSAESDAIAAEAAALLQPQFVFYDAGLHSVDRKEIDKILAEQLYPGVFSIFKRGQNVPF